ncbi:facilitated trehalose transporter Tret1 isoform X2 [Aedes albopictus]|uniref:Major facilitator superfamily (MFS) profile domain-containing protein n=1 Tax=Aedes albopictus TaxID=7160 RepID=A0ABM2A352_AEDAL
MLVEPPSMQTPAKAHYRKQYLAAVIAALGAFSIGTIFGWSAPVELGLLDHEEAGFEIRESQFAWVVSLMSLGGAVISLPAGLIVPTLGARNTLLLFVLPTMLGWICIIWANNVVMLLAGRTLTGFGAGAFCMVVPIYIGEIASKEIRGTVGSFFQQMINLGIVATYALGLILDVFWLSVACGVVPIVYGVLFFFMPNTPTYLVHQGQESNAIAAIKWLRGIHADVTTEINEIRSQQQRKPATVVADDDGNDIDGHGKWPSWKLFRQPATVRALIIMLGIMFFMQASGVNAVLFYSTSIFQAANAVVEPELATIIIGSIQVFGTLLSSLVVDRLGRRVLLLTSGSAMCIGVLTLGVYFLVLSNDDPRNQVTADGASNQTGWIPIVALCLYVTLFAVGFGPVPWLLLGEIFASEVKGPASALANMTSFAMSFVLSLVFPLVRQAIGSGPMFIIFSVFCALAVVFVALVVPETKGKSLNEIQSMLAG